MSKLKVLLFDVETAPVLAWIWRTGANQYIDHTQILKGQKFDIICICYKWLGEKTVHTLTWDKNQNSAKMVDAFTKVIESAHIVVGHNSDKFDQKQLNTQRLMHGQPPIAWPTSEDTLKQLRKVFAFPTYRLDYVSKLLTGSGKDPMTFQDWIDIVQYKSPKAMAKMTKYCRKDVLKLEEVYKKVMTYCAPTVNASRLSDGTDDGCPRCGSKNIIKYGFAYSAGKIKQRYRCRDCGTPFKKPIKKT